jgi:MoaA/NifB/PqqE/SkfB family radical SAM enzyme
LEDGISEVNGSTQVIQEKTAVCSPITWEKGSFEKKTRLLPRLKNAEVETSRVLVV